jgi:hypothetical protein
LFAFCPLFAFWSFWSVLSLLAFRSFGSLLAFCPLFAFWSFWSVLSLLPFWSFGSLFAFWAFRLIGSFGPEVLSVVVARFGAGLEGQFGFGGGHPLACPAAAAGAVFIFSGIGIIAIFRGGFDLYIASELFATSDTLGDIGNLFLCGG